MTDDYTDLQNDCKMNAATFDECNAKVPTNRVYNQKDYTNA